MKGRGKEEVRANPSKKAGSGPATCLSSIISKINDLLVKNLQFFCHFYQPQSYFKLSGSSAGD